MEYKFIISGRLNGLNEYTAANRTHPQKGGKMKKDNEELVIWEIRRQLKGIKINHPVRIMYDFYEPNKKRDLDNKNRGNNRCSSVKTLLHNISRNFRH